MCVHRENPRSCFIGRVSWVERVADTFRKEGGLDGGNGHLIWTRVDKHRARVFSDAVASISNTVPEKKADSMKATGNGSRRRWTSDLKRRYGHSWLLPQQAAMDGGNNQASFRIVSSPGALGQALLRERRVDNPFLTYRVESRGYRAALLRE